MFSQHFHEVAHIGGGDAALKLFFLEMGLARLLGGESFGFEFAFDPVGSNDGDLFDSVLFGQRPEVAIINVGGSHEQPEKEAGQSNDENDAN